LESGNKILRVCVQFKHTQQLSSQESEKAIRTTDPANFLSVKRKGSHSPTCSNPAMRKQLEEAIKNFGDGTMKAGRCGLLRVVISHPTLPVTDKLEDAAGENHPVATVPLQYLFKADSEMGQLIAMLAELAKGKASDEIEGQPGMKQKNDTGTGVQGQGHRGQRG
jgi:hypothetical protein